MSAPNVKTIMDALATAYGSLTPPSGLKAISQATATPPNSIPTFPFVTVVVDDGDFVFMASGADVTINAKVRFWLGEHTGDLKRNFVALNSWLGILLWATLSNTSLGLSASNVKSAIPGAYRLFVDTYGSVQSNGWEIDVPILLRNVPIA